MTPEEREALDGMVYSPLLYSLATEIGRDVREVATWPMRLIRGWMAYLRWEELQRARREEEREIQREIDERRHKAKRSKSNAFKPTFGTPNLGR